MSESNLGYYLFTSPAGTEPPAKYEDLVALAATVGLPEWLIPGEPSPRAVLSRAARMIVLERGYNIRQLPARRNRTESVTHAIVREAADPSKGTVLAETVARVTLHQGPRLDVDKHPVAEALAGMFYRMLGQPNPDDWAISLKAYIEADYSVLPGRKISGGLGAMKARPDGRIYYVPNRPGVEDRIRALWSLLSRAGMHLVAVRANLCLGGPELATEVAQGVLGTGATARAREGEEPSPSPSAPTVAPIPVNLPPVLPPVLPPTPAAVPPTASIPTAAPPSAPAPPPPPAGWAGLPAVQPPAGHMPPPIPTGLPSARPPQ